MEVADNNAVDHAMEAAPTDQEDKLLVDINRNLIAPDPKDKSLVAIELKLIAPDQKDKLLVDINRKLIAPILMDLDELKEITNVFSENDLIGEGSSASVYYGIIESGTSAAITKLDSQNFSKQIIPRSLGRYFVPKQPFIPRSLGRNFFSKQAFIPAGMDDTEFTVVRVKHENVVELLGYCVTHNRHFLVYEHASNGSLRNLLHGFSGAQPGAILSWSQRVKIAVGAAKGLQYLHQMGQIHQAGIKSSNVLVFDNDVAKIFDIDFDIYSAFSFQIARMNLRGVSHVHGSAPTLKMLNYGHRAPEYKWTKEETSESNVYSFGGVLLELLTGHLFFDHISSREESWFTRVNTMLTEDNVERLVDHRLNGEYPRKAVAKMAAVAESCVQMEPKNRPKMDSVVRRLQHLL